MLVPPPTARIGFRRLVEADLDLLVIGVVD
jgi:hypothetical protein